MHTDSLSRLYNAVRDVPDFPRAGILFRDITPILGDALLFRQAVQAMLGPVQSLAVDRVVAIESRGFLLAAPIALELSAGLVPARKVGKLPYDTHRADYALEYGADAIEIHRDGISRGDRVLVVDDLIATGGTAEAAVRVVRQAGGTVLGVTVLIELADLGGRTRLGDTPLWRVLRYPRE